MGLIATPFIFFVMQPLKKQIVGESDSRTVEISERLAEDPQDVLNNCLESIGMGSYQWKLFTLCGLGWAADNMLFNVLAVIVTQITYEYQLEGLLANISTTAGYAGFAVGALAWGYLSDIIGRRTAFMYTFVITGVFCILAGFARGIVWVCLALAFMGFGFGGNLPIDGALFLECIPPSKQSMLTLLSLFWPLGGVLTSVVGWVFMPNNSCAEMEGCTFEANQGWRYVLFSLGSLTLIMCLGRYLFPLQESPKYYIARGKYGDAVRVLKWLAEQNNVELDIKASDFQQSFEASELAKQRAESFWERIKPLFAKELLLTTVLVWLIWIFINIGYNIFNGFLPYFLANAGSVQLSVYETYRNYVIINIVSVPGSIVGWKLTDSSLGRKGTLAASTLGTAAALVSFTYFTSSTGQLICSCVAGNLQNIMFGVAYAYTPEVFPTYVRSTAYGAAASLGSLAGVVAPLLVAVLQNWGTNPPLYLSAILLCLVGICTLFLPIETRGRFSQ
jgi:MFS family permease